MSRPLAGVTAALACAATACGGITVTGPVTEVGDGRICVDSREEVPGGGCATYDSPADVAGIEVGDCVVMRLYSESARFRDVRETDCP